MGHYFHGTWSKVCFYWEISWKWCQYVNDMLMTDQNIVKFWWLFKLFATSVFGYSLYVGCTRQGPREKIVFFIFIACCELFGIRGVHHKKKITQLKYIFTLNFSIFELFDMSQHVAHWYWMRWCNIQNFQINWRNLLCLGLLCRVVTHIFRGMFIHMISIFLHQVPFHIINFSQESCERWIKLKKFQFRFILSLISSNSKIHKIKCLYFCNISIREALSKQICANSLDLVVVENWKWIEGNSQPLCSYWWGLYILMTL